MNQHKRFWDDLERFAVVDKELASEWIRDTIPKAVRLLGPDSAFHGKEIQVEMRFAEPASLPLGRWMGCYPELKDGKGDLTIIADWSFSHYVLYLAVEEACEDKAMLREAFLDRSRIKIGVTNDVYQPFAPLPPSYSMVRHHSLILYLSFAWLTEVQRERWRTVCRSSGEFVAKALLDCPDPLSEIRKWEEGAREIMLRTAVLSCTKSGAEQILSDRAVMEEMKRYFALTCFGIDVVARSHEQAGGDDAWNPVEIGALQHDDYLEQPILDYIAAYREESHSQ